MDWLGILFGTLLGVGIDRLISWLYDRKQAKKVKLQIYRNAYLELRRNIEKITTYIDEIGGLYKLADATTALGKAMELGPPKASWAAFDALEKCIFLTPKEFKEISQLDSITIILDERNANLEKSWKKYRYGADLIQSVKTIMESLKNTGEQLVTFYRAFQKILPSWVRKTDGATSREEDSLIASFARAYNEWGNLE